MGRATRPSSSLVISFVALFVALSGTALALQANSVKSKHIVDGQVKGADVKPSQVQLRVGGTCPSGQAIRVVNQNGTVACEVDDGSGAGGPPTGPAGGDLAGTYPNPQIATGAVGPSELATDAITSRGLGGARPRSPTAPWPAPRSTTGASSASTSSTAP